MYTPFILHCCIPVDHIEHHYKIATCSIIAEKPPHCISFFPVLHSGLTYSKIQAKSNLLDFLFMFFIIVFNYSNIRKFYPNSIIQCESQAVLCYNSSNISKRINFSDKICLGPFPGEKGGTPCQRKCPCPQNPFRKSLPLSDPTSEN